MSWQREIAENRLFVVRDISAANQTRYGKTLAIEQFIADAEELLLLKKCSLLFKKPMPKLVSGLPFHVVARSMG